MLRLPGIVGLTIWLWILNDAYDTHVTDWQYETDAALAAYLYERLLADRAQIQRVRARLAALRS